MLALGQRHLRIPLEGLNRQAEVGPALFRVVLGQGQEPILDLLPVSAKICSTSSSMLNSPGLPTLTEPVKSSGLAIMRNKASTRSSTQQKLHVCLPAPSR